MKNLIITLLATCIFYSDICVIHIPMTIPFIVITFYLMIVVTEDAVIDLKRKIRRWIRINKEFIKAKEAKCAE